MLTITTSLGRVRIKFRHVCEFCGCGTECFVTNDNTDEVVSMVVTDDKGEEEEVFLQSQLTVDKCNDSKEFPDHLVPMLISDDFCDTRIFLSIQ